MISLTGIFVTKYKKNVSRMVFRLDGLKDDFESTDKMFADLESELDGLRKELYRDHEPKIRELPPIDLNRPDVSTNRYTVKEEA